MRVFISTLLTTIALGLLAGCSGGMATAPGAGLPSSDVQVKNTRQEAALKGSLVALQAIDGSYVTAVDGGDNMYQPNCGLRQIALHENATSIGLRETFTMVSVPNTPYYAFQTIKGYYITAVNGGGMGGPNGRKGYSQLHTNGWLAIGPWQKFTLIQIEPRDPSKVAIQTPDGHHYITAANGGGCGTSNTVPFHTNAKSIGRWEEFRIINV